MGEIGFWITLAGVAGLCLLAATWILPKLKPLVSLFGPGPAIAVTVADKAVDLADIALAWGLLASLGSLFVARGDTEGSAILGQLWVRVGSWKNHTEPKT